MGGWELVATGQVGPDQFLSGLVAGPKLAQTSWPDLYLIVHEELEEEAWCIMPNATGLLKKWISSRSSGCSWVWCHLMAFKYVNCIAISSAASVALLIPISCLNFQRNGSWNIHSHRKLIRNWETDMVGLLHYNAKGKEYMLL